MLFLHDIYHIIGMEQDNLYNLLQSIDTPDDLRHLSADKLPEVCKELRQKIIDELSCNPGHFGSSLGVIELTVALHYVFNTPYDRIVWDVGHQAAEIEFDACPQVNVSYSLSDGEGKGRMPFSLRLVQNASRRPVKI